MTRQKTQSDSEDTKEEENKKEEDLKYLNEHNDAC
jgi:hypothetical protein